MWEKESFCLKHGFNGGEKVLRDNTRIILEMNLNIFEVLITRPFLNMNETTWKCYNL